MPKRKTPTKTNESKGLTKSELVNYIGPIFEDIKVEMKSMKTDLRTEMKFVESRLNDKINWQGTLMEQMNKKFDVALELTEITHSNNMTVNVHSTQIENLERDVRVLKAVRTP